MSKANNSRQEISRAHIGPAQSDLWKHTAKFCLRANDSDITGERHHRTGTHRGAMDSTDDRFIYPSHILNERTGDPRKRE